MTYRIQPGKNAPCELVQGETVVFEGTHTACKRAWDERRGAALFVGVDHDGMARFVLPFEL